MKNNFNLFVLLLTFSLPTVNVYAQSTIRINEVFSRGVAGDLDWVEVYNTSSESVDISGYKIYDSGAKGGTKSKKLFPSGTILPAKGFAYIIVDTATFAGDTSGFGISNSGETVWLENASGTLIDTVAILSLGTDTSYARIPDGSDEWVKTTPRTKGKSNVFIKMNEIYSRGVAGNLDWIEIYNASSSAIDISGYKIYDNGAKGGTKSKKLFPAGTILSGNGFSVIIVDSATFVGDTSGFGISNSGETVWLENASGLVIDVVTIAALGADTSYARIPDGSNTFVKKSPTTKGLPNGTGTSVHSEQLIIPEYSLQQNYPNPFNPTTTIVYQLQSTKLVSLKIYDVIGREVALLVNKQQSAGEYRVPFNASALSSGVYFYRLSTGNYSINEKNDFAKMRFHLSL